MADEHTSPIAKTKHGEISLDQIADMMPGMARLMVEISDRFWIMYYAAKNGGWMLARHEYGEMRKTMLMAGVARPKYLVPMRDYITEKMKPVEEAMRTQDWAAFEKAFQEATDAANEMHVEFGYDCITWQLPEEPPKHLKLTP
jgi:hypothetical protein